MSSRLPFHSQLSSILETMARSALSQICKLVDEDSAELRLGLSQLLGANSALEEQVTGLESELAATGRSDEPPGSLCKSYRSVGVQTVCHRDGDAHVSGSPTIEGIFGKDWCMNLWKDRDPYSLERDSPQSSEEYVATLSNQITVTEIKEEDVEDVTSSFQQETLSTEEHEESMAEEPELLSVGYSADGSACSLSVYQAGEPVVCAGGVEEPTVQLISISDTEEAFSTHIIPIEEEEEEEEDDYDLQFVEESHQEPLMNSAGGPSHDKLHTLSADDCENSTALEKDSHFNMLNVETARDPDKNKFTCQICDRTFFHKGTLTLHMKSHKSNFCHICKQHFHYKNKFKSHTCVPQVPSQTDSKSCEVCGKTFANPSALRIHYLIHTGEKPHTCGLCGKGFSQKGNLKCHLRIHTGERPYRCGKCGKTFTQKVNLNHHLLAHRNNEIP